MKMTSNNDSVKSNKSARRARRNRNSRFKNNEFQTTLTEEKAIQNASKQEETRKALLKDNVIQLEDEVTGPKLVLGYIGIFLMMVGIISLFSLFCLFDPNIGKDFYEGKSYMTSSYYTSWEHQALANHSWAEEAQYFWIILVPGVAAIVIGAALYSFIFKKKTGKLKGVEDIVLILAVWIIAILVFATPFLLARFTPAYNEGRNNSTNPYLYFTFSESFFEATSALTTTGLTVMTPEHLPRLLTFHRALGNFFGGVGLVLLLTSFVSRQSGGMSIYSLEGHNDQLLANLGKSARLIFGIYSGIVAFGVIALICCGVSPLDAFCFSMSAVSTGGLASHSSSVIFFESYMSSYSRVVAIKIILMLLMLMGSTNFLVHWLMIRFKFNKAFKHYEFLVFFFCLILIYPFIFFGIWQSYLTYYEQFNWSRSGILGLSFINSMFEYVSAISTTGLSTINSEIFKNSYGSLPSMTFFAIIILMTFGGQNGSTAGGLKQSRVALFFMNIRWTIQRNIRRPEIVKAHSIYRYGEKVVVTEKDTREAANYFGMYLTFMFLGVLTFCCHSFYGGDSPSIYSFQNSLYEAASCLSSLGTSTGIIAFAASHSHNAAIWTGTILMFVGRFEVTIVVNFIARAIRVIRTRRYSFYNSQKGKRKS